ncbi:MAG TPA: hypothetical protein VNO81_10480, partial [Candidatus Nitrosotenuis sp.]|nr:hypothetical protein [Candidatus Nitrosotenuis sp.]
MDHAALVELITERVIQELLKGGDGVAPAAHNPSGEGRAGRPVLVAPAPGARAEGPVWEALRSLQGIRWIGVAWPGYPEERLRQALGQVEVVSAPFHWEALVTSAE